MAGTAPKMFGTEAMRMVELPLDEVQERFEWSARGAPSEEEIERATERFRKQPMLHPPAVVQREGRWELISGFLRFAVWRRMGLDVGTFRHVEGSDSELYLLNFAENVARRKLKSWELVERVAFLRARGVSAKEISRYSGYTARYIRQLAATKRDAHPELWVLFVEEAPHLTMRVMLDLVAHPPEEQLERWIAAERHWRRGDTSARGFSEEEDGSAGAEPRRRFPRRREVQKLLSVVETEPAIDESYRKGLVDALRWLLFDTELSTRFSWRTLKGLTNSPHPAAEPAADAGASESRESRREAVV